MASPSSADADATDMANQMIGGADPGTVQEYLRRMIAGMLSLYLSPMVNPIKPAGSPDTDATPRKSHASKMMQQIPQSPFTIARPDYRSDSGSYPTDLQLGRSRANPTYYFPGGQYRG